MKIYEFTRREDLVEWFGKLPVRWLFGHSGDAIIVTPFKPVGKGWNKMEPPIRVPFESFRAIGGSEAEVCMKLALQIEEYLGRQGNVSTIRQQGNLMVNSERDFDTDRLRWRAAIRLCADIRLDEIDAERAKRAE